MPTPKKKRNYKKEYADFHGKPEQRKNRSCRNKARADAMKKGKVRKGDGKEVDHVKPLSKGGSKTAKSNQRVVSRAVNRKKAAK